VAVLAVATAAWLAHHGGYERLVAAVGEVPQHPLFAAVADERIGPGLTVQRGLVVAVLAGAVGAGGLVSAGWAADLLGAVARATGGSGAPFFAGRWQMGIPPTRLPVEWLFEASFLLAVVLVTGPRLRARAVAAGVAVVVAVQSTVALLPMLVPPSEPVFLLAPSGPVLTPLGDVVVLLGIAVGVRVGLHDGGGRLRYPGGSRTDRRGT
jgi:hypothetical protein